MTTTVSSASSASRMRCESGSECTGFDDSTMRARNRSGWSVRISSGIDEAGMRPVMIRWPVTGVRRSGAPPGPPLPTRLANRVWICMPPGIAEVAGDEVDELLEVGAQRRVRRLLDAEVLVDRDAAAGAGDAAGGGAHVGLGHAGTGAPVGDGDAARARPRARRARWRARPASRSASSPSSTSAASRAPRHQASPPGRTWRWMSASSAVSVRRGSMTIIDRPGSAATALRTVRARGKPWDCHGFLPDEHQHLGVLPLAGGVAPGAAEELPVDPELAGLLLGEGVRRVHAAERGPGGPPVGAAEVVALAATAVAEDRRAAVGVAHVAEPGGDLGDGGVPVDRLVGAVGPAAHRRRQPVAAVLVVVEPQRLLAGVAGAGGVGLVAAHPLEGPTVVTAEAHLDPAVDRAEDARGLVPLVVVIGPPVE